MSTPSSQSQINHNSFQKLSLDPIQLNQQILNIPKLYTPSASIMANNSSYEYSYVQLQQKKGNFINYNQSSTNYYNNPLNNNNNYTSLSNQNNNTNKYYVPPLPLQNNNLTNSRKSSLNKENIKQKINAKNEKYSLQKSYLHGSLSDRTDNNFSFQGHFRDFSNISQQNNGIIGNISNVGSSNKINPSVINLSNQNSPRNIVNQKQDDHDQNSKNNTPNNQNNNSSSLLKIFLQSSPISSQIQSQNISKRNSVKNIQTQQLCGQSQIMKIKKIIQNQKKINSFYLNDNSKQNETENNEKKNNDNVFRNTFSYSENTSFNNLGDNFSTINQTNLSNTMNRGFNNTLSMSNHTPKKSQLQMKQNFNLRGSSSIIKTNQTYDYYPPSPIKISKQNILGMKDQGHKKNNQNDFNTGVNLSQKINSHNNFANNVKKNDCIKQTKQIQRSKISSNEKDYLKNQYENDLSLSMHCQQQNSPLINRKNLHKKCKSSEIQFLNPIPSSKNSLKNSRKSQLDDNMDDNNQNLLGNRIQFIQKTIKQMSKTLKSHQNKIQKVSDLVNNKKIQLPINHNQTNILSPPSPPRLTNRHSRSNSTCSNSNYKELNDIMSLIEQSKKIQIKNSQEYRKMIEQFRGTILGFRDQLNLFVKKNQFYQEFKKLTKFIAGTNTNIANNVNLPQNFSKNLNDDQKFSSLLSQFKSNIARIEQENLSLKAQLFKLNIRDKQSNEDLAKKIEELQKLTKLIQRSESNSKYLFDQTAYKKGTKYHGQSVCFKITQTLESIVLDQLSLKQQELKSPDSSSSQNKSYTIYQHLYYIDSQGYILDNQNYYLLNQNNQPIKLSQKQIQILKILDILKNHDNIQQKIHNKNRNFSTNR